MRIQHPSTSVGAQICSDSKQAVAANLRHMRDLILLEDEVVLCEELTEFLVGCGYRVHAVSSLDEFRKRYRQQRIDLAVIDLGLPDGDGLTLIRELRAQGNCVGIVVLTARGALHDRVEGLEWGADHYLSKSADLDELAATLLALSRRLSSFGVGPPPDIWTLQIGARRLYPPFHDAINLSEQDSIVLQTLMKSAGSITSRRRVVEALGVDFLSYDQRRLDTQMRRLHRKVSAACGLDLPINTVSNVGYRFYAATQVRP